MTVRFAGLRLLAVLLVTAAAACASAASATAAPSVATAPGRAVVDIGDRAVSTNASPLDGFQESVSEPDGSILLLFGSTRSPSTVRVMRIGLDGAPDRSFGDAGVKTVDLELSAFDRRRIVRQPDGKLVIVSRVAESSFGRSHTHILRLNADLSIDATYGMGGSMTIDAFAPQDAALQPDGSLLLTGTMDGVPASTPQAPNYIWSLARVTSGGAVDRGFGTSGIVTIPMSGPMSINASGDIVAAGPGGTILTVAHETGPGPARALLTRLTATGAPDSSFAGGVPVKLPLAYSSFMLAHGDGSVLLEGQALGRKSSPGQVPQALVRYTVAGALDPSYGEAGVAYLGDDVGSAPRGLLPGADGGTILSGLLSTAADGTYQQRRRLEIRRLSARGTVTMRRSLTLEFGGGYVDDHEGPGSLPQSTFSGGRLVPRPDGTFLVPGSVKLSRDGDDEEIGISRFAAAVLTPSLRLDHSFGGPARRLRVSVGLARQDGAVAVRRRAISVKLRLSSVGLAGVRIAHRGRAMAGGLLAVLGTSSQVSPIRLTPYGRQYLREHPHAKLSITVTARDLLTNARSAHAAGRLG